MKDVFDRIAASSPQNATAARVTGRGEHYDPNVDFTTHWHADAPPRIRTLTELELRTCGDIPGRKFGRMTVIGLTAEVKKNSNASWIVRCVCGDYEQRKAKAIRNPLNNNDMCQKCRHFELVKARLKTLGSRSIDEIILSAK